MNILPILETQIKKQLSLRLVSLIGSTIGTPIAGVLTWAVTKYIVGPAIEETEELVLFQYHKIVANHRLKDVNESANTTEFNDTFLNL